MEDLRAEVAAANKSRELAEKEAVKCREEVKSLRKELMEARTKAENDVIVMPEALPARDSAEILTISEIKTQNAEAKADATLFREGVRGYIEAFRGYCKASLGLSFALASIR